MNSYVMSWTNELQQEKCEEIMAQSFASAVSAAKYMSRGNEGLWFNVVVTGTDDEYYEIVL